MFKSKRQIFELTQARWPATEFRVLPDLKEGLIATSLSDLDAYISIERSIDQDDDWNRLAIWAFNQALRITIKIAFQSRIEAVTSSDVTYELFDKQMRSNLAHPDWAEERDVYNALP